MFSRFINTIFLPIRIIFSPETVNRLGLRSLRDERCDVVMKYCRGRLLDIGCGKNQLVRNYGHGSVGVDVYDFGGNALIVEDTSRLPFKDEFFETVSFVASLNHIPNRREVLRETNRLLSEGGRVLVTMLPPFWGTLRHKSAWWDQDQRKRGMKEGEKMGLTRRYILRIMADEGFTFIERKPLTLRLNSLYVFEKRRGTGSKAP
jgi:SAM-dependent methyltransferase